MVVSLTRSVRALALKIAAYGVLHLVVAMAVTFALTRDWHMALAVGVIEPFAQTVLYSFHDRVWHVIERRRLRTGLEETAEAFTARLDVMNAEEQSRAHGAPDGPSIRSDRKIAVKTATYSVLHFTLAVLVVFAIVGDWRLALIIGVAEPPIQMVAFAVHDRLWARRQDRAASA